MDEGARGSLRVPGPDERLADERGVKAQGTPRLDGRRILDAGLRDREPIVGHQLPHSGGSLRVHRQRSQVPVVDADDARTGRERGLDLALVVRLHERLEPEISRLVDQPSERTAWVEHRKQEHRVGARGPQELQLPRDDDELLGQHGHADGPANELEILHRAAEPVWLAQDRDRGGAAGLVGPRPHHDVLRLAGDLARRWGAALDLGDEVQAGCREAIGERTRRRRVGETPPQSDRIEALEHRPQIGPSPIRDLADHPAPVSPRLRRPTVRGSAPGNVQSTGTRRDRHAGLPAAAIESATERSARSMTSRSRGIPASRALRAAAIPSLRSVATSATTSAAPAFRRITSRCGPDPPAKMASISAAFSSAVPPASSAVAARRSPNAAGSTVRTSTSPPLTSWMTPLPSSGSSPTPAP